MKTVLCYTCIYDIIFITQFLKSNINYKYPQGHRVAPHPHPWETNLGVHLSLITLYTNHTVSFYNIISNSNFIMSNCTMICEWRIGMDVKRCDCSWLRYYPGICMDGLRKNMENISQDSQWPGQDLNQVSPNTSPDVPALSAFSVMH